MKEVKSWMNYSRNWAGKRGGKKHEKNKVHCERKKGMLYIMSSVVIVA